jgi:hypothetical protein
MANIGHTVLGPAPLLTGFLLPDFCHRGLPWSRHFTSFREFWEKHSTFKHEPFSLLARRAIAVAVSQVPKPRLGGVNYFPRRPSQATGQAELG